MPSVIRNGMYWIGESQYAYMDYGSVADRMEGIASVFPVFFFLVAALVCLTTMTRNGR